MRFFQILISSMKGMFPGFLIWAVLPMIPFIIAEQRWPVGEAPRCRDYGMNILISLSTAFLSLPLGIAAGLWSGQLRHLLPWKPISFSFHNMGALPVVGPDWKSCNDFRPTLYPRFLVLLVAPDRTQSAHIVGVSQNPSQRRADEYFHLGA
jgi:hypothetical protein